MSYHQSHRYLEIDIFKGIAILAVVAIHFSGIIAPKGKLPIEKFDDFFFYSVSVK